MTMRKRHWAIAGAVAVITAGGGAVLAHNYVGDDADEVAAVQRARVSLAQAVTAAERGSRGRALEASIETDRSPTVYEVKVFAENWIKEVHVDPQSGRVLHIRIDRD